MTRSIIQPIIRSIVRPIVGDGGGMAAPLPYTLLDSFDSLGSRTITSGASQSIVDPVEEGAGSLEVVCGGVQNVNITNPNIGVSEAPTDWDLMAVLVDYGDDPYLVGMSSLRPTITTNSVAYAYQIDSANGGVLPSVGDSTLRGKRWRSFKASRLRQTNWAGALFTAASSGTKQVAFQLQQASTFGDYNTTCKIDALIRPQRHKPVICITADDVNTRQRSEMADILQSRGLVATGYACMNLFGTGSKLTLAEAFELKDDYGWAWCLNSGTDDRPIFAETSRAASITALNAHRDALIASGLGSANDAKHMCYSYGVAGYRNAKYSVSATCNDTTTVTLGSSNAWSNFVCAGMVVKGTTLGTNPTVVSTPTQGTAVLSASVPSGTRTLTFCGNQLALAVTCNGTTTVTCDSTGLFPGQLMTGNTVPANTTIVSVDTDDVSGSITVSNAVPSTCTRASFHHVNGEFYARSMEDDLLTAGYLSSRKVVNIGGVYTGYGIDPKLAINLPSHNWDSTAGTTAKAIADLQMNIDDCADTIAYIHFSAAQDASHFETICDFIEAEVAAGNVDVLTIPQWWARVSTRGAFA